MGLGITKVERGLDIVCTSPGGALKQGPGLLEQRPPTFLAPGTGFVEDKFSMDCGAGGDGSGRDASGWGAMGSGR